MVFVALAVLGYLSGSALVAPRVARVYGVDLRTTGDGNPGAWNALAQLGFRRAWPAFVGDGAKGLLPGMAGLALAGPAGAYAGVAGAMLGHAFPLGAPRNGGKAVMTFAGGAFALCGPAAFACLGIFLAAALARRHAAGARLAVFAFPVVQLAFAPAGRVGASGALMTLIGLRFLLARTSARATSGSGGARST